MHLIWILIQINCKNKKKIYNILTVLEMCPEIWYWKIINLFRCDSDILFF